MCTERCKKKETNAGKDASSLGRGLQVSQWAFFPSPSLGDNMGGGGGRRGEGQAFFIPSPFSRLLCCVCLGQHPLLAAKSSALLLFPLSIHSGAVASFIASDSCGLRLLCC